MRADTPLSPEQVEAAGGHAFILDPSAAVANALLLTEQLDAAGLDSRVWYAVKCNPDLDLLRALHEASVGFEIASVAELRLLQSIGVDVSQVPFTNPIRTVEDSALALTAGVRLFTVDSLGEVARLARAVELSGMPAPAVALRLAVPGTSAMWDLSGKFGVLGSGAREVAAAALVAGLDVAAVSFHVGSQSLSGQAYAAALPVALDALRMLRSLGAHPSLIDIGGGLPASYSEPSAARDAEAAAAIVSVVSEFFTTHRDDLEAVAVAVEPGRFVAAPAGRYLMRVLGTAERGGQRWLHTSVGAYNGPFETRDFAGKLDFPLIAHRAYGPLVAWHVTGPTCDSSDVVCPSAMLPESLEDGDVLEMLYAGAYSTTLASSFNGFAPPPVFLVKDGQLVPRA